MKLAILVALATVAAVSSYRPSVHSVVYKPGEQYVYHYKAQILNGIPKSSKQFSGLLIDSLVVLQFQQDHRVVMKFENIKLFKIDNKISSQPSESIPESEMTRLTGEQEQAIVRKLLLPVKFRYEEGEIREVQNEMNDKYWSINIKKGALSIFQVTLKEKHSLSSDSSLYYDPTLSRIKSYGFRSYGSSASYWNPTSKTNSVYTVKETDITGNCETKYTIISDKTHLSASSSVMYVTAVRNFDSCSTKPFNIEGFFQGVQTSLAERELIHPTDHTDYVISGDRSHFLIKEATRRGKYFVYVNGLEGADLSSYVYQKLTLKEAVQIRRPIHLVSPKVDTLGLQMIIPKANLIPEQNSYEKISGRYDSFLYKKRVEQEYELNKAYEAEDWNQEESVNGDTEDIIPVVEQKLRQLIQCVYAPNTEKKCSDLLMEATMILREASKEQLKTIYTRYVKINNSPVEGSEYRMGKILLDILSSLSTPDAGKVLVELIRERHVTPLKGSLLINSMSLVVKPTPSVIKLLLEMFKQLPKETTDTALNEKAMLRQSTLLAVGTLTHRLLVVMRSQGKPVPELVTFVDTISMEMKRLLEESSTDSEKILILKSLGNMGASENIMVLKNFVEDRKHSLKVRSNAAFSLRRLARDFRKQVNPILMGVFMDTKEDTELRQAAFLVIIKSNPSYTTLQMIAHRINHDKAAQIRSLVYTHLVNLAFYTSHQPEHKTLVKNARMVLKTIHPVRVGFYDSMSVLVNKFSEKFDCGVAAEITKLKSKMSGLPYSVIANLQATLLGKHRNIIETGAEGRAVEMVLRKVFGPHGLLSQVLKGRVNLENILKPILRSGLGGVEQKILEIMNKMRMETPIEQELFATWYLRFLGNELQYVTLNEKNVRELNMKLMNLIQEVLMELKRGTSFDLIQASTHQTTLTVATAMGIPLSLNHSIYAVAKMDGSAKISHLPTDLSSTWEQYKRFTVPQSWDQFKQFPFSIPELNLDLKIKPLFDVTQFASFSADLRWLTTGVATENYLRFGKPMRFTAELNKAQQSISVKYFPTKETIPMLHVRAVPFIFISYIPTTAAKLPHQLEVREIKNEEIVKTHPFNFKMEDSMTGQMCHIQGVYSICGPTWCPITPLFGKQELIVVTKPTSTVEFLELKLKSLRNNFEFEGIPAHLSTHELYQEEDDDVLDRESVNYRMASRRSALLTDEFEPVPTDPIFHGEVPIRRQIRLTLRPNNRQVEALKSQFTWLMSRNYWINQVNVQVIRSANQGMPDVKLVLNTVVNPLAWYPEESYRGARGEYLSKTDLAFNVHGDVKRFQLKVVPGTPFNFVEEMKQHKLWPIDDESKTKKYQYTVELDFPQLNHQVIKGLMLIDDSFKYMFYDKLTTDLPRTPLERKLIASFELLPEWEKMHIIVKNPREEMYIANVPFYWNPFVPTNEKVKLHNRYAWDFYKPSQSDDMSLNDLDTVPYTYTPLLTRGECKVDFGTKIINTFDGAKYSIQPTLLKVYTGCGLLAAQDCSKQGLFSLSGLASSIEDWDGKLHLPNADIELKVVSKKFTKVMINGEVISLSQAQVYRIPSAVDSESVQHEIEMISDGVVMVKAKELGLIVSFDQKDLSLYVQLSHGSMLWGNICGLCGNNNQDPSDDMEIPRNLKVPSSLPFYMSNLIPSDTCDLNSPVATADYSKCQKTSHVTIRRYDNEVPMKCTTEKKIIQCSEGCKPTQVRSVKTCFRCQSESGQSLIRRSYYQPSSVWQLEDSSMDCEEFAERLEVPTTCEPLY